MSNTNEILIHLGADGWLATYAGPHAAEIGNLFGTCTLLTAFTARAPLETVLAEVTKRHPNVNVRPWC